jgi:chaperone modulatory protein CbpM
VTVDTIAFLARARLDAGVLETWIGAGWVVPRDDAETRRFAEIDVARARLISDLKDGIGVNDEGVAIILDLIDQIHGLRGSLRDLSAALSAQPEAVRRAVAADLRTVTPSRTGQSGGTDDQQS